MSAYRRPIALDAVPVFLSPLPAFDRAKCCGCGEGHPILSLRYCTGSWWRGCKDTRPHMHIGHDRCGAHYTTQPAFPARWEAP